MMLKGLLLLVTALVFSAACVYADPTAAGGAVGSAEINLLKAVFTGNIGLALGLIVAFFGLYTMVVKGNFGGGLFILVLGVLITLLPTFYNGVTQVTCPIARSLGGECGGIKGDTSAG